MEKFFNPIFFVIMALFFSLERADAEPFSSALKDVYRSHASADRISFKFFGTSSFLIEANGHQMIVDGFVSRPKHLLVGRIKPNTQRIEKFLWEHDVCKSLTAQNRGGQSKNCANNPNRHLDLVVTMHAHYDHALDAPYITAWAGAKILNYPSLERIVKATARLPETQTGNFNWDTMTAEKAGLYIGANAQKLSVGPMNVRLALTPHGRNLISNSIKDHTPKNFDFRSTIWNMGLGASFSMALEYDDKIALIVASAGKIENRLKAAGITRADVVFLGIGGIGFNPPHAREEYWEKAVSEMNAKRVFLIHWDNHQEALPVPDGQFSVPFYEKHDVTLRHFRKLAARDGVELLFPPSLSSFDPFFDLPAK